MKNNTFALSLLLFLIFGSSKLVASPQMPDYIIYKSDTVATYNLLVEQYLQNQHQADSGKLFGLSFREGASFNCWRGYQAIYKVENDSLFLVNMIGCGTLLNKNADRASDNKMMQAIFGGRLINGKVFINWFSGDINFPLNKNLIRWDGVFRRIYEKERVIKLAAGKVIKTEDVINYIDNPKSIDRKYGTSISDIFFDKIKRIKWKNIKDCDCSAKYIITINQEGKVSKIKSPEQEDGDSDDKAEGALCKSKIFAALSKLRFDVIKDKGKPMAENVYMEIWIEENGKIENWTR